MSYVSLRQFMQARGLDPSQGLRALAPGVASFSVWAIILGDLSGIWNRDDGGKYYISHSQNSLWWAGLSSDGQFYDGLGYSNVFSGTIAGNQISGRWADVPRGSTRNAGSFQLIVNTDPVGNITGLSLPGSSSPFWVFEASSRPDAPDIWDVFSHVLKNQHSFTGSYESLVDNLWPYKAHPVVVFGKIPDARPSVGILQEDYDSTKMKNKSVTYEDFICWPDDSPDGDLTFVLEVDRALLQGDFWTADWQYQTGLLPPFKDKLNEADGNLHCEAIMYGRITGCGDHSHDGDPPSLPGWQESAGNSVLINGVPIGGLLDIEPDNQSFHVNAINKFATYNIQKWVQVRVTGILALDHGHTFGNDSPEIHPVFAIDIVNATPQENLSGVWADQINGLTVYIRHIGSEIWWLTISPTLDYRVAQVFQGTILPDGKTIQGMISDVPLGTTFQANSPRSLACLVDPGRLFLLNTDQSVFLNKLYDAD